jgi:predicted DNA-binding helix-hairpin-helix protein
MAILWRNVSLDCLFTVDFQERHPVVDIPRASWTEESVELLLELYFGNYYESLHGSTNSAQRTRVPN